MINNLLTSLARSVRKSICLRVFCSDLTRSSFGLYENFRQILFSTLTSCYPFCYCFSHLIFCHIIFFSRIYINSLDFLFIQCFSLTKDQRSKRQTLLCRQYTNLFIFQCVSQHWLRSTLHFMFLCDEGPTFEMLDFAFFLTVFEHYVYINMFVYLQE